jgi:hypothetical protein
MISPTNFGQIDLKAFIFLEVNACQFAGVPQCTRVRGKGSGVYCVQVRALRDGDF